MEARSDVAVETWTRPALPFAVQYPLPVFYELEFLVSEGYRRIPYGGIEHGGFLFGQRAADTVTIQAFRQIESDHASGPSFSLSAADIERARAQLNAAAGDPELAGLQPLGLFISHGRKDLAPTAEERNLLETMFPGQTPMLLIVKPEKFKGTRFAFVALVNGSFAPFDGLSDSFLLPIPSRSERPRVQAVPAPPEPPVASPVKTEGRESKPTEAPEPKVRKSRARPRKQLLEKIVEPVPASTAEPLPQPEPVAVEAPELSTAPQRERDLRIWAAFGAGSALVLLPCVTWFYWRFLEPPLMLHALPAAQAIHLSWDRRETLDANDASLHIYSSRTNRTMQLSIQDSTSGRSTVQTPDDDVTIELIVPHWLRDRRGIVRVVRQHRVSPQP